ncbi:hypothetical protein HanPSC8_Chr11g0456591 [Helianthus annuus]|nr:hypothetical protein HanPSC8_Chr11g0456591 [Helianthus annuus]
MKAVEALHQTASTLLSTYYSIQQQYYHFEQYSLFSYTDHRQQNHQSYQKTLLNQSKLQKLV